MDKLNAEAYFERGIDYYNKERYKEAEEEFKKALKIKRGFAELYYGL